MNKVIIALLVLGLMSTVGLQASYFYNSVIHHIERARVSEPQNIPFIVAAQKGDMGFMRNMLNKVPKEHKNLFINMHDKNGESPLMHAVVRGQREVVSWLINHGADLTKTNNVSVNALEAVAEIIAANREKIYSYTNDKKQTHDFEEKVIANAFRH